MDVWFKPIQILVWGRGCCSVGLDVKYRWGLFLTNASAFNPAMFHIEI
jgi:hypothetical protein